MRQGVSARAVAGLLVAVAVIAASALFWSSQSSGSASTTTSVSTTPVAILAAANIFNQHLQKMEARQHDAIMNDYSNDSVVVWSGNTAGLGGTYTRKQNIRLLLAVFLGDSQSLSITPTQEDFFKNKDSQVTVNATLELRGNGSILGPFNGTILATTAYTNSEGTLKIGSEKWTFATFFYGAVSTHTTFPEWQDVGEPISSRRSPDWLHNFAWDYGGLGVAILIWGFLALVAAAVAKRARREPSRPALS